MTKVYFTYTPVEPTELAPLVWDIAFSNYLLNRHQFPIDMAKQELLLQTLADEVGLKSSDAPKLLEALYERVRLWRRYTGLQKVPEMLRAIEAELKDQSGKMVILAASKDVLTEMRDGLAAYGSLGLFPGTPLDKRTYIVKRFQTNRRYRVLVANPAAAGIAMELTVADRVRIADPSWFVDNNVQALMRVCNWRQEHDVSVRFYGLKDTIEERIIRQVAMNTRIKLNTFVAEEQHTRNVRLVSPD